MNEGGFEMSFGVRCMGSRNVVSIAAVCEGQEIRDAICKSDYVRNETLRRLCAIPSYKFKSLAWKNRYYDVIKAKVLAEIDG